MEMEAHEAILKNKSSSDCEIEEVFKAFHDKGKVQCNACNNARKEIVKCKPKSTFTPKLNKLEGLQDVYNFKSTHCQSDSHLYALSVWGGKPREPMGFVTEHVRRLKENSDTANHDGEGKDESYHHAGTGIYKDLSIKNFLPHCGVCGVSFSVFQNGWRHSVANHFTQPSHNRKASSNKTQPKLSFASLASKEQ